MKQAIKKKKPLGKSMFSLYFIIEEYWMYHKMSILDLSSTMIIINLCTVLIMLKHYELTGQKTA